MYVLVGVTHNKSPMKVGLLNFYSLNNFLNSIFIFFTIFSDIFCIKFSNLFVSIALPF